MTRSPVLLLCACLVACGGGAKQGETPRPEPATQTAANASGRGETQNVAAPDGNDDAGSATERVGSGSNAGATPVDPAPAAATGAATEPAPERSRSTAAQARLFFDHLAAGDYPAATAMFHFPPSYTASELTDDTVIIEKWLRVFTEELGKVTDLRAPPPATGFEAVGIGGGTEAYWAAKAPPVKLILEVDYLKEGKGYVILGFCHLGGKVELQSVTFGLPENRPDATQRLQAIDGLAR